MQCTSGHKVSAVQSGHEPETGSIQMWPQVTFIIVNQPAGMSNQIRALLSLRLIPSSAVFSVEAPKAKLSRKKKGSDKYCNSHRIMGLSSVVQGTPDLDLCG